MIQNFLVLFLTYFSSEKHSAVVRQVETCKKLIFKQQLAFSMFVHETLYQSVPKPSSGEADEVSFQCGFLAAFCSVSEIRESCIAAH